jgi:hypothetical protein
MPTFLANLGFFSAAFIRRNWALLLAGMISS